MKEPRYKITLFRENEVTVDLDVLYAFNKFQLFRILRRELKYYNKFSVEELSPENKDFHRCIFPK